MDVEEKLQVIEDGFKAEKDSLKQVLLDIRVYLMEAQSPLKCRNEMREALQKQRAREGGQ